MKNPRASIEKIAQVKRQIEQNPFSQVSAYQSNFSINRIGNALSGYNVELEYATPKLNVLDMVVRATPEFQRSNNQWVTEQKIAFIENLLAGYKTDVRLFGIHDGRNDLSDTCLILDGLQRLTAIAEFMNDHFPVYGEYYYSEINDPSIIHKPVVVFHIHTFRSLEAAIQFYIQLNKGFGHSNDDIDKANSFLEKYKNEERS